MLHTLSVLVVDSYPDAAESTAMVLLLNGIAARVTHGCGEALAVARDWRPDVILFDIPLADGDGYRLIDAVRDALGYLPLAIVATGLPGCEEKSRRAGCDHHFTKPIDPRLLIDVLEQHADTQRAVIV